MLVSIIIPVYNASSYIQRCLDSCLAQTCPDFEVICVDDGSTDGSGAILDEYAELHQSIKVFHQPNAGVVAARNKAIAEASGEFCYFLDSDDWLPATALEDLLSVVDGDTDIVFGNQAVVYAERTEERRLLPQADLNGLDYVNESLRSINGCIGGKMFRTSVCRRLAIDNSMRLNEDLLMNIQAGTMARKVRRIDTVNYFYNWAHDGSLSKSQSDESFRSIIAANRRIAELLNSRDEYSYVLNDGYIAYLQKNIVSALGRKSVPEEIFLVKEAKTAILASYRNYMGFTKRFGTLCVSLWLAPLGLKYSRLWRNFVLGLIGFVHRNRTRSMA
jgi:glycosyltransferase involved in cell wall biosynthesis